MEKRDCLDQDRNQLPEARLRDKEIQELYKLFRSYGISIPIRSLRFLQKRSNDPYSVDMRIFMRNTGYSCCDNTIDAIWKAYLEWAGNRMSIEEFLEYEKAEAEKLQANESTGEESDNN